MKIVFDAYWWVEGPPSLRHVLREIILAWAEQFPGDEFVLVMRRKHASRIGSDLPKGAVIAYSRLWPQALLASTAVSRAQKRYHADAVLSHNFAARIGRGASSGVFLHDVMFVTNPEWFTFSERRYFSLMTRWIRRADVVFTSSESEGARIARHTKARTVAPIGLGISEELTSGIQQTVREGLNPGSFLLTVGRLNARKNLRMTIRAALATGRISKDLPLVVVGGANGKAADLDDEVNAAMQSGVVIFTGFVDESELRWLYASATAFLFLSLGEGYGMPPVEALYFGTPVLVSDLRVFREILGAHADYVDPTDFEAIVEAINQLVTEPPVRLPVQPERWLDEHSWTRSVTRLRYGLLKQK